MPTSSQCLFLLTSNQNRVTPPRDLIPRSCPKLTSSDSCLEGRRGLPIFTHRPLCEDQKQNDQEINVLQTVGPTVISIKQNKPPFTRSTKPECCNCREMFEKHTSSACQGRRWYLDDSDISYYRNSDDIQCSKSPKLSIRRCDIRYAGTDTNDNLRNDLRYRHNEILQADKHKHSLSYSEFRLPHTTTNPKNNIGDSLERNLMVGDINDKPDGIIRSPIYAMDFRDPCGRSAFQTFDTRYHKDTRLQELPVEEYQRTAENKRLLVLNEKNSRTFGKTTVDIIRGAMSRNGVVDTPGGVVSDKERVHTFQAAPGEEMIKKMQGATFGNGMVEPSQRAFSNEDNHDGATSCGQRASNKMMEKSVGTTHNANRANSGQKTEQMGSSKICSEQKSIPQSHRRIDVAPNQNSHYGNHNLAALAKTLRKKLKILSVRMRRELPPPMPLTVCFNLDENSLNHSVIKKTIENRIGISPAVLQYEPISDYMSNLGTIGRWLATFKNQESCKKLASEGLHMYGERIWVRPYDNVVKEEYEAYRLYRMVIENQDFRRESTRKNFRREATRQDFRREPNH